MNTPENNITNEELENVTGGFVSENFEVFDKLVRMGLLPHTDVFRMDEAIVEFFDQHGVTLQLDYKGPNRYFNKRLGYEFELGFSQAMNFIEEQSQRI